MEKNALFLLFYMCNEHYIYIEIYIEISHLYRNIKYFKYFETLGPYLSPITSKYYNYIDIIVIFRYNMA